MPPSSEEQLLLHLLFWRRKRWAFVCVQMFFLCGIVKESLKKTSLFFPLKEKDIFIEEIKREKGEGNLSRV